MFDKEAFEKFLARTPHFIIIIGLIIFIIGAAGGLPVGNPPREVSDLAWRIALGVIGLLLLAVGILLLLRESATDKQKSKIHVNIPPERFFIWLDHPNRPKLEELFKISNERNKRCGRARMQVRLIDQAPNMAINVTEHENPEGNKVLVQLYFHHALFQNDRPMFIVPYKDKGTRFLAMNLMNSGKTVYRGISK